MSENLLHATLLSLFVALCGFAALSIPAGDLRDPPAVAVAAAGSAAATPR